MTTKTGTTPCGHITKEGAGQGARRVTCECGRRKRG